jgi:hypothetical protein
LGFENIKGKSLKQSGTDPVVFAVVFPSPNSIKEEAKG